MRRQQEPRGKDGDQIQAQTNKRAVDHLLALVFSDRNQLRHHPLREVLFRGGSDGQSDGDVGNNHTVRQVESLFTG